MLLPVVKLSKPRTENIGTRVSIRISKKLSDKMAEFHKPKEKSKWVSEAVVDLFNRQAYVEADWKDSEEENLTDFLMLMDFNESIVNPKNDIFILDKDSCNLLNDAVKNILPVIAQHNITARSVKPSLIRGAIRQRLVLGGGRTNNQF
jgi:hypothetical protein